MNYFNVLMRKLLGNSNRREYKPTRSARHNFMSDLSATYDFQFNFNRFLQCSIMIFIHVSLFLLSHSLINELFPLPPRLLVTPMIPNGTRPETTSRSAHSRIVNPSVRITDPTGRPS